MSSHSLTVQLLDSDCYRQSQLSDRNLSYWRITTDETDRRGAHGAKYQFEVNKRWTVDGSPRWNVAH
jgi:hypothetical protein